MDTVLNIHDNEELRRMYYSLRKWQFMGIKDGELIKLIKRSIRAYNATQAQITELKSNAFELDKSGLEWLSCGLLNGETLDEAKKAFYKTQYNKNHSRHWKIFQRSDGKFKYVHRLTVGYSNPDF